MQIYKGKQKQNKTKYIDETCSSLKRGHSEYEQQQHHQQQIIIHSAQF